MARHLGFWSLVAAIILTALGRPVAGADLTQAGVVVEVYDHAGVSVETLTRAKSDVSRIYADMGVEVLWTGAPATNAHGRFVIHLIIRPKASRPRMMGNALGDSRGTGGTAFVYHERVLHVARARDLEVARVLAYAMAHEMGHLLLPYPSHSIAGIMQADWDGHDFRDMAAGSLAFTPAEASAIRARALRTGGVAADREKPLPHPEMGGMPTKQSARRCATITFADRRRAQLNAVCQVHHTLIDLDDVEAHPESRLLSRGISERTTRRLGKSWPPTRCPRRGRRVPRSRSHHRAALTRAALPASVGNAGRACVSRGASRQTWSSVYADLGQAASRSPRMIKRFDKAWKSATVAAPCPRRIPHDFRRTAVRNMVRQGMPERVAMALAGHKTRSVFDRYNIVSPSDPRAAAAQLSGLTGTIQGQTGEGGLQTNSEQRRIR